MKPFLLALLVAVLAFAFVAVGCGSSRSELGSSVTTPNTNKALPGAGAVYDMEPQPLDWKDAAGNTYDAALADGGTPDALAYDAAGPDGGWYADANRYPTELLVDCDAGTKAYVAVDLVGKDGLPGQVHETLPLTIGIWHQVVFSKIYQVGLTSGCTPFPGY